VYHTEELSWAENIVFAATGVTDGSLLKAVRFFGHGLRTPSLIMNLSERKVRFIDTVHLANRSDIKVRV
jgi:fructose-1,6-bisphosphatase/sedoheptulose 1,7-bisphosphatase-like protein